MKITRIFSVRESIKITIYIPNIFHLGCAKAVQCFYLLKVRLTLIFRDLNYFIISDIMNLGQTRMMRRMMGLIWSQRRTNFISVPIMMHWQITLEELLKPQALDRTQEMNLNVFATHALVEDSKGKFCLLVSFKPWSKLRLEVMEALIVQKQAHHKVCPSLKQY